MLCGNVMNQLLNQHRLAYAGAAKQLGDDTVRCIAMGSTDGLVRGMDAEATGAAIMIPVGEGTLGRIPFCACFQHK